MSDTANFSSRSAVSETQTPGTWNTWRIARRLGTWGFAFFALKGIAWLLLPLMAMHFV